MFRRNALCNELRETDGFKSSSTESDRAALGLYTALPSLPTTLHELPREKSKSRIDISKRATNSEARNEASVETLIDHGRVCRNGGERGKKTGDRGKRRPRGKRETESEIEEGERTCGFTVASSSTLTSILSPGSCVPTAIECARESSHVVPYRPDTRELAAKTTNAWCIGERTLSYESIFRELHET